MFILAYYVELIPEFKHLCSKLGRPPVKKGSDHKASSWHSQALNCEPIGITGFWKIFYLCFLSPFFNIFYLYLSSVP
jgi:hypothetical protein